MSNITKKIYLSDFPKSNAESLSPVTAFDRKAKNQANIWLKTVE